MTVPCAFLPAESVACLLYTSMGWKETEEDQQLKKCHDLIEKCYGSDMYELVELYAKLNESGKNKIMGELRDTVALSKYTVTEKRENQKMA